MTVELTWTRLAGGDDSPAVMLAGPSLGTAVSALWGECASVLGGAGVEVLGWDLPGHGRGAPATEPFGVADLADRVRADAARFAAGRPVSYAGVSLAGAVGLMLSLDPGVIGRVAVIASAPRIGEPPAWHDRAALVRRAGTAVMVAPSAVRWFAPGFPERRPEIAGALLTSLADADAQSYALACEALARFDLTDDLKAARVPLLFVAGEHDPVVTPDQQRTAAASVPGARTHVAAGCGHLPPAEDPDAVAALLLDFLARPIASPQELPT